MENVLKSVAVDSSVFSDFTATASVCERLLWVVIHHTIVWPL